MLGGVFPLISTAMFTRMTFAGAASFLGGVGAILTVVPWVLVFFGPKIRARSKFASVSYLDKGKIRRIMLTILGNHGLKPS